MNIYIYAAKPYQCLSTKPQRGMAAGGKDPRILKFAIRQK